LSNTNTTTMPYFSHYLRDAQSKALKDNGAFFAFGDKQFNEQKVEGVEYVDMGGGLICPKANAATLRSQLDAATTMAVETDVAGNGMEAIVRREYFNHESHISMDTSNAMGALYAHKNRYPRIFTDEAIEKVFSKCWKEALKRDMF
jgi:hypothetical protein